MKLSAPGNLFSKSWSTIALIGIVAIAFTVFVTTRDEEEAIEPEEETAATKIKIDAEIIRALFNFIDDQIEILRTCGIAFVDDLISLDGNDINEKLKSSLNNLQRCKLSAVKQFVKNGGRIPLTQQ